MVDGGNDIKPSNTPTFLGGGAAVDITDTVKSHTASIPTPEIAEPVSVAPPPIPPVANPSAAKQQVASGGSYAQAQAAGDMPSSGKSNYISAEERDRRAAEQVHNAACVAAACVDVRAAAFC